MRRSLTGAVITAALLIPASAAQASFVALQPSSPYRNPPRSNVFYGAEDGETNTVTVTNGAGNALVVNDPTADIESFSDECTVSADKHTATCTPAEANTPLFDANLRDGNDTFTDSASIPSEKNVAQCFYDPCDPGDPIDYFDQVTTVDVDGGPGTDTLNGNDNSEEFYPGFGDDTVRAGGADDYIQDEDQAYRSPEDRDPGAGNDRFFGGAGSDYLAGGDGDDELRGEDGDDYIEGNLGADTIDGGAGFDGVYYGSIYRYNPDGSRVDVKPTDPGATVNLDANATTTGNGIDGENDSITQIEDVDGSFASDTINGSSASNVIFGNSGDDKITGGAGNDNLSAGDGDDTVNSQDGEIDAVDCGGGSDADKAGVDNIDTVRNCGTATIATNVVPPAAPVVIRDPTDTTKAKITKLAAKRKVKAKTFRRKGKYRFSFVPDEASDLESALETKASKRALRSTVGYITLANKSRTALAAGKKASVTLTVKKSLRKKLKKGRKLRLIIRLTDAGGNITLKRVTIKLT